MMKHLGIAVFGAVVAAVSAVRMDEAQADGPTPTQLQAVFAAGSSAVAGSVDPYARQLAAAALPASAVGTAGGAAAYSDSRIVGAVQMGGGDASGTILVASGETIGRTQSVRLSDVYNIADHGARGDAASDTAAMNKAIAYATASPGTHIYIPQGTWPLNAATSAGFAIPSSTTVEGADQSATIVTWNDASGYNLFTSAGTTTARASDIRFQNFTVQGSWNPTTASAVPANPSSSYGNPFIPANVDGLTFFRITSENSHAFSISARTSTEVNVQNDTVRWGVSDGINLSECADVSVTDNMISHTDDDSISVHSDIYDSWGVRRDLNITGNRIFDSQGIRVLSARQANISGNTLDTVRQQGINVQTVTPNGSSFQEGVSAGMSILISNNTISNVLNRANIDNLNSGASAILIDGYSARAGSYAAIPGENNPATGKIIDPYPEFMANSTSTSVPTAGTHSILIVGNHISRTLPNSNGSDSRYPNWASFGQGTISSRLGAKNPTLAESDIEPNGVFLDGGYLKDVLVEGNDFHGLQNALFVQGNGHLEDIAFRGNSVVDMTGAGVVVNMTGKLNLYVEDNLFDLDPYMKGCGRGPTGNWSTECGPEGLFQNSGSGVVFRRNVIRNALYDTNVDPTQPNGGDLFEDNIDEAEPVVVNDYYSSSNKGIARLHREGFRLLQLDSDPTSATYDTFLTVPISKALAVPTTGYWVAGAFVANATPSLASPVYGWLRLTTSASNLAGTDWIAITGNAGGTVSGQAAAYTLLPADCGTIIRDTATAAHTYTVPSGLAIGCRVDVIQAGSGGTITFVAGSGETLEQAGTGTLTHATTGQFTKAGIMIDSTSTFLLSGQVQ